jgi:hypothetical protein
MPLISSDTKVRVNENNKTNPRIFLLLKPLNPPPKKDPRKILGAYGGINHVTIGNILGNCLQNWGHVENIIGNL